MRTALRRLGRQPASPALCRPQRPAARVRCCVAAPGQSLSSTPSAEANAPQPEARSPDAGLVPPVAAAEALEQMPFYSQFPLDRKAEWRKDVTRLNELFARPDARLLPLLRDKVLVRPAPATPADAPGGSVAPPLDPVFLSPASAHSELVAQSPARPFLGLDGQGRPYFAAAVGSPTVAEEIAAAHPGSEWRSARLAGPDLAPGDASLLAVASGLMLWHGSNAHSPVNGERAESDPGGFSRRAAGGGASYPRVDPAVIMLVTAGRPIAPGATTGEFALLGRKSEWPTDRFSTLAGFLELGEPLEVAVAREVEEESGVPVELASVTYAASQPWPFPRSLMVGFHARAASSSGAGNGAGPGPSTSGNGVPSSSGAGARQWWQPPRDATGLDLLPNLGRRAAMDVGLFAEEAEEALGGLRGLTWPHADVAELQDVRWFHRDWLRTLLRAPGGAAVVQGAGRFNVPGRYSLAYRLITSWAGVAAHGGPQPVPMPAGLAAPGGAGGEWEEAEAVPQVLLSADGTFKYVLMRLWDPAPEVSGRSKLLVWGDVRAPYHNDVLQKAKAMARRLGLKVSPLGGGRIHHDAAARSISVYGYSAAFGPAPHEVAAALIHRWYPLYDKEKVSVSYEGY
ncbi:hypothetical protein HYH03_004751 [Edaphochlamys debaryana]|uniref:NAD(+) diphosphatase n=1 Tax=Edaphochlamys debaryana TaxID=47281 RepID=A0A835Y6X6_9CHLO|nr:hypothetical protein HYH03_004751 [Edaphochlamys debaryana]|eukprot:KAG2497161.1 hypothetical protein HYH03_004751 [Edaphochlamys debaryana]